MDAWQPAAKAILILHLCISNLEMSWLPRRKSLCTYRQSSYNVIPTRITFNKTRDNLDN